MLNNFLDDRFALCYRIVVCRVCEVGVWWPNGETDQDETWHAGRNQPRPHCVRWGLSCTPKKGQTSGSRCHLVWRQVSAKMTVLDGDPSRPQNRRHSLYPFSAHVYCGHMAGRIKMPPGTDVSHGPGDIALDGDPAPLPKKGAQPLNLHFMSIVAKRLDGCHLVWRQASAQVTLYQMGTHLPPKGHSPQFSAHVFCGQTARQIKMLLGMKAGLKGLGPGDIVLDGAQLSPPQKGMPPIFGTCLLWPNGRPSQLLLSSLNF